MRAIPLLFLAACASGSQAGDAAPPADRMLSRRAVEAVIWGMPVVNFDVMFQAMVRDAKAGPGSNKIVYWSRLFDWKNQTLTPNPDTIYLMPFFDLKAAGPVVIEVPAADEGSITGSIMDCWQIPLEDVGPAGVDKGKGGKYVILPPGHQGTVPDGYIALPCDTFTGYALMRSNLKSGSDADVARAVEYGKRIKLYPLSQAGGSTATTFVDAADVVFDANIPYDVRFFESLDRMVQGEPWMTRDKVMINVLRSVGIEKGKPFRPDSRTGEILKAAALEAREELDRRYDDLVQPPFFEGTRWALPASKELTEGMPTDFADPNSYPVDARGLTYSLAFFAAKHLGAGQFYLMTPRDKSGRHLSGARSYRLHVPSHPPVRLYWSATLYDRSTHALIRNMAWASRSSNTPDLRKNADGSVDLYFAPSAPAGKESNWVPTDPKGEFEVLVRFYGPEKPLFEKTWRLPDIEEGE
jgi:hypothetical protein